MATRRAENNSINDRMFDSGVIRHERVLRFQSQLVNEAQSFLTNEMWADLSGFVTAHYERIGDSDLDKSRSFQALINKTKDVSVLAMRNVRNGIADRGRELAKSEGKWAVGSMEQEGIEASVDSRKVVKVVGDRILGQTLKTEMNKVASGFLLEYEATVAQAAAEGWSEQQLRGNLAKLRAKTDRHVEAVVRTTMTHSATQAREEAFGSADGIRGVMWTSILDSRTSAICRSRDGNVYKIGEGPRPPAHPNCRSTMTLVVKGTKNASTPSYGEWLKDQGRATQDEVLGKTRGKAFRAGKLDMNDMVSKTGRPLTLDELNTNI